MDRPVRHVRESRRLINRRQQGDLGEASAIDWLTRVGATVSVQLGHSPDYDLIAARSIDDALDRVAEGWRPFAGGTDLMVLLEAGKLPHKKYVSIRGLRDLRGIDVAPDHVRSARCRPLTL